MDYQDVNVRMKLTEEQSRTLLAKYALYASEACDKCGKILGPVRYKRKDEPGEWCSRLCRNGAAIAEPYRATRRGGRPPKYRTDRERRRAERRQNAIRQQAFRQRHPSVTENPLVSDSFHVSTEAKNQPLAISIAGEHV
jgi:hypothetical protein